MVARSQRMVNPGAPGGTMGSDSREGPDPETTRILGELTELLRCRRVDPAPRLHKRHLTAEGVRESTTALGPNGSPVRVMPLC